MLQLTVLLLLAAATSSILACDQLELLRNAPEGTCEDPRPVPVFVEEHCVCFPWLVRHEGKCIDPNDCPQQTAATTESAAPTATTALPVCSCSHIIGECRDLNDHENCAAECASARMGSGSCGPGPVPNGICTCFGPYAPGTFCARAYPECLATTTSTAATAPSPTIGPGPITITFPAESTSPSTTTEAASATTTITAAKSSTTAKPEARCARIIRGICGIIHDHEKCTQACQAIGLYVGVCLPIQSLVSLGASVCVCLS